MYNASRFFQDTIANSLTNLFNRRYESLFSTNSLAYFLTADAIYREDSNYLSRLNNNRLEKEMKTQEDLLYNSLVPFFDIYSN